MKILPLHQFSTALDEERTLLGRGRYESCLVVFDVGERAVGPDLRKIGNRLVLVLRKIDVTGWVSDKHIGVILTGAGSEFAWAVAARLAREVFPFAPEPTVTALRGAPRPTASDLHSDPCRLPRFASGSPARVHSDPAGLIGLLAKPLPRWKRVFDIALASAGLILIWPLLLVIALAIKATSRGDVIYRQKRTGHRLQRFSIYKFRTMRNGSDRELVALQGLNEMSGPLFKSDADPRVTTVGRFLRRTSLDELPQLLNVLRGEMTLLGPRALSPQPDAYAPWQLRRFSVTPGLACEWQASRRGETDFEAWMRSDLRYVDDGPSVRGDLVLFVGILFAVLTCSGGR